MGKKVKISSVKRSQHIKHKKNYARPQKNAAKAIAAKTSGKKTSDKALAVSKKVFGKPTGTKSKKRDKGQDTRELYTSKAPTPAAAPEKAENGTTEFADEMDDDDVQDMLDMIHDDENGDDETDEQADDDDDDDDDEVDRLPKKRKRKEFDDDHDESVPLEQEYAHDAQVKAASKKRTIDLLPIKTKKGEVITRSTEVEFTEEDTAYNGHEEEDGEGEDENQEEIDSDDEVLNDTNRLSASLALTGGKAISTADLLILREQEVNRQKYRIGIICSGILEKPDDKMKNFNLLFDLMGEKNQGEPNLLSVRKVAILSMLEVFKDIIPEYRIGQIDLKKQQVKKTTMERVTFEDALLTHFKKYLQRLEKLTSAISKGQRRMSREHILLAQIAATCLCELLIEHPYFNFGQNIAQLLVYLLNCNNVAIRAKIHSCFQQVFKEDKKFDLTLFIVRRLNHLIKSKSNLVHVEIITCLLALQIKSINLNDEKENELKQKKMEAHKARLVNMSKKERKRMKKLKQLDKELQESKAEENKQTKQSKLTEISKMVFAIYFRILKNDPNSQSLSATLEGLAEFAHVINLDFFADLVEVLNYIMDHSELGYREQLHCVQTVFTILSGQGEVLNIDPLRFYGHLYRNLLVTHAGKNHQDFIIILKTLNEVLVKRRKNITPRRMLAFLKRIAILSLQLQHNGTLASLGIIKTVMQLSSTVDQLLDTDTTHGSGQYDPQLNDPEYCNADCTALYEMSMLTRHYHPIVRKIANNIAAGVPASGERSLVPELGKLSPLELFDVYDSSAMVFNPSIPPPRPVDVHRYIKGRHYYVNEDVEVTCKSALRQSLSSQPEISDFYTDFVTNTNNI